jgi:O-6-methylguanine DNA methyltransferase
VALKGRITSEVWTFGSLELTLHRNAAANLIAVLLPEEPPKSLSREQVLAALTALEACPVAAGKTPGETAFRAALSAIPAGRTRTYGEIARELGTSPRAIGSWCASNRLLLRIPCHRVIAATGLSGFRAGLHWKRRLLELEL